MNADDILDMVDDMANLPYGGEPVDQRSHAYQAATLAFRAGADDELVTAALLHDIGRHRRILEAYPGLDHEDSAQAFLGDHFRPRVAWLAWSHVPAKRYLVTTEPGYRKGLSPVSEITLGEQGGPMSEEEVAAFAESPWLEDALQLRRWDDQAKVPNAPTIARAKLEPRVAAALDRSRSERASAHNGRVSTEG